LIEVGEPGLVEIAHCEAEPCDGRSIGIQVDAEDLSNRPLRVLCLACAG
jgi:hypothetical protein